MYYKLSNNFSIDDIEDFGYLKFKFPDAYQKRLIVDGLQEEVLPVILSENPGVIDFGIWGLLPQNFKEDWFVFQSTGNTLNTHTSTVLSNSYYNEVLLQRRCCILVSGFFASYYSNGEVFPIYVYSKKFPVISLAGIYNLTYDGFITTTVLLKKSNAYMSKLHNLSKNMPIIIGLENRSNWLNDGYHEIIHNNNDDFEVLQMGSHSIAKEFYKNNIIYDTILEPVQYENLTISF
ncbi:MAG: SOS response-associated peptidase family protein [Bacteroidota bacterium]